MKKYRVTETKKGEFNFWHFGTEAEAKSKYEDIVDENERQGLRMVSTMEWSEAERKVVQEKMFQASMEEITPDMPEWEEIEE